MQGMGYELVGKVWDAETFDKYVKSIKGRLSWAKGVTVHHTAAPSLAQRPKGWTIQHMRNLQHFYQKRLGWSAGPHLFTDEDQIFGMSGMHRRGVHAVSFNRSHLGIEMLGNFDSEDPNSGRGLECQKTTAHAVAILLKHMGLTPSTRTINFHRDDPKTSKSCAGRKADKKTLIALVKKAFKGQLDNVDSTQPPAIENNAAPHIPGWSEYDLQAGVFFVPVMRFLLHLGASREDVLSKLASKDGKFVLGSNELEKAYYSRSRQETWAPVNEVLNLTA